MKKLKRYLLCAASAVLCFTPARADVLVHYAFSAASTAPTSVGTGVDADDFVGTFGADESASSGDDAGFSSGSGNAYIRTDATGSTAAAALSDDDYFSFEISALNPGEFLDLESLVFDFGGSSGTEFDSKIYVQSSVGGFGTGNPVIFSSTHTVPASSADAAGLTSGTSVDLTGFAPVETITFQFRFSDDVNQISQLNRLDNVILNGAVVIPEPSSLVLLSMGVLGVLIFKKKKITVRCRFAQPR
ncbi:PEP-CTERM sorting domain-containing protein [Kiritimatiellaeota bacterium B1221]|nr:PEP-CTERM sorting domain-containing protein [Kiritimatiellaeota bacterium B1221]